MSEEQQSIAQELRQARERKNLALDEIHRQTGISLPVLKGLEDGDFTVVEPIYTRMALQSYAQYLDLDAAALTARFERENGPVVAPINVGSVPDEAPTSRLRLPLNSIVLRTIGLGLVALVILLLVISLIDGDNDAPATQTPAPEPARPASTQSRDEAAVPKPIANQESPVAADQSTPRDTERAVTAAPMDQTEDSATATPPDEQPTTDAFSAGQSTEPSAQSSEQLIPETATEATTRPEDLDLSNAQPETVETPPAVDGDQPLTQTQTPPQPALPDLDSPTAAPSSAQTELQTPTLMPSILPSSGIVLEVEALDSTWIQIRWDGKGKFEGIVPRGERRRFEADDHFLVLSGRAHGLRYWFGDELLGGGQLGEATKVLRFRASADGVDLLGPNFQPLAGNAATAQP
jgi:cytoskeletal protein RodZ